MAFTEYKVLTVAEGGCGTVLAGSSGLPIKELETELNAHAEEGWQLVFQTLENNRYQTGGGGLRYFGLACNFSQTC